MSAWLQDQQWSFRGTILPVIENITHLPLLCSRLRTAALANVEEGNSSLIPRLHEFSPICAPPIPHSPSSHWIDTPLCTTVTHELFKTKAVTPFLPSATWPSLLWVIFILFLIFIFIFSNNLTLPVKLLTHVSCCNMFFAYLLNSFYYCFFSIHSKQFMLTI